LLLVGSLAAFNGPGGESALGFSGVCIKSGLVLGALWLALPQIQAAFRRTPRWLLGWFTRRQEPAAKTPETPEPPPTRQPRPRRRSTS
jgi:hypothetical protein